MSSMENVFQLGLGCLRRNLSAVMSCSGTRLSEAEMTTVSCEPSSEWGSGISWRLWRLTTQSAKDWELVTN